MLVLHIHNLTNSEVSISDTRRSFPTIVLAPLEADHQVAITGQFLENAGPALTRLRDLGRITYTVDDVPVAGSVDLLPGSLVSTALLGDASLLPLLSATEDRLTLHVSDTGSDVTGDGRTQATAWASFQYALDQIPDGARGQVFIRTHGVGAFLGCHVRDYRVGHLGSGQLNIWVIADTDTPSNTFTLGAPTRVANGAGAGTDGNKQAVQDYGVGAYSTVFTNRSHWIEPTTFDTFLATAGILMDGAHSTSPKIRLVDFIQDYSSSFPTVHAHAFKSQIKTHNPLGYEDFTYLTCAATYDPFKQTVTFVGFDIDTVLCHNVALQACVVRTALWVEGSKGAIVAHTVGEVVFAPTDGNTYAAGSFLAGIFETDPNNQALQLFSPYCGMSGILRASSGNVASCMVGSHVNNKHAHSCAVGVTSFDVEAGVGTAFHVTHGSIFFDAVAVDPSVSKLVLLDDHATADAGSIYGRTNGVCVQLNHGAQATGFAALASGAPALRNSANAGQDIKLASLNPQAWSSLPATDAGAVAAAVQFVRAE
jgi:hypothetical protein